MAFDCQELKGLLTYLLTYQITKCIAVHAHCPPILIIIVYSPIWTEENVPHIRYGNTRCPVCRSYGL